MSKTAAERQRDSRRRKRDTDVTKNVTCHETDVTPGSEDAPQSTNADTMAAEHPGTVHDILDDRDGMYYATKARDEVVAERTRKVPIPGDPDYVGVCKQVDGVWQVKPDPVDMQALTDADLIRRLHCIRDWKHSPEHQEVLRRRNEVAA